MEKLLLNKTFQKEEHRFEALSSIKLACDNGYETADELLDILVDIGLFCHNNNVYNLTYSIIDQIPKEKLNDKALSILDLEKSVGEFLSMKEKSTDVINCLNQCIKKYGYLTVNNMNLFSQWLEDDVLNPNKNVNNLHSKIILNFCYKLACQQRVLTKNLTFSIFNYIKAFPANSYQGLRVLLLEASNHNYIIHDDVFSLAEEVFNSGNFNKISPTFLLEAFTVAADNGIMLKNEKTILAIIDGIKWGNEQIIALSFSVLSKVVFNQPLFKSEDEFLEFIAKKDLSKDLSSAENMSQIIYHEIELNRKIFTKKTFDELLKLKEKLDFFPEVKKTLLNAIKDFDPERYKEKLKIESLQLDVISKTKISEKIACLMGLVKYEKNLTKEMYCEIVEFIGKTSDIQFSKLLAILLDLKSYENWQVELSDCCIKKLDSIHFPQLYELLSRLDPQQIVFSNKSIETFKSYLLQITDEYHRKQILKLLDEVGQFHKFSDNMKVFLELENIHSGKDLIDAIKRDSTLSFSRFKLLVDYLENIESEDDYQNVLNIIFFHKEIFPDVLALDLMGNLVGSEFSQDNAKNKANQLQEYFKQKMIDHDLLVQCFCSTYIDDAPKISLLLDVNEFFIISLRKETILDLFKGLGENNDEEKLMCYISSSLNEFNYILDFLKNNKITEKNLTSILGGFCQLSEGKAVDFCVNFKTAILYSLVCNPSSHINFSKIEFMPQSFFNKVKLLIKDGWDFERLYAIFLDKIKIKRNYLNFMGCLEIAWSYSLDENKFYELCACAKNLDDFRQKSRKGTYQVTTKNKPLPQLLDELERNNASNQHVLELIKDNRLKDMLYQINDKYDTYKNPSSKTDKAIKEWSKTDILNWLAQLKKPTAIDEELSLKLAVMKQACFLHFKYRPYAAQLISVIVLCLLSPDTKGRFVEIPTGEGKTTIIAMINVLYTLHGMSMDSITSSSDLALRDSDNLQEFYALFGINISCNIVPDYKEGPKNCYKNPVVYGNSNSFSHDWLMDKFSLLKTMGKRKPCGIMIDEVDHFMIDNVENIATIAEPIPGMDRLKLAIMAIWNRLLDLESIFLSENNIVIDDNSSIDAIQIKINSDPELKEKLLEYVAQELKEYVGKLKINEEQGLNCAHEDVVYINIPKHLVDFFNKKKNVWIETSIDARYNCTLDKHYAIREDENQIERVIPIDSHTGEFQSNTTWDDGLQQSLQIKHGLSFFAPDLTTNYLSNSQFVQLYPRPILGVTGTLGEEVDRTLINNVCLVDFVSIPSNKVNQRIFLRPILEKGDKCWLRSVSLSACKEASYGRVSLILCESVGDAKNIHDYIFDKIKFSGKIHNYTENNTANRCLMEHEFDENTVIIATQLGGRGTDIKVTKGVVEKGGVHLCISYLCENSRGSEQAKGRTGRRGEPGTIQNIFNLSQIAQDFNIDEKLFPDIIAERNRLYAEFIQNTIDKKLPLIRERDRFFAKFRDFLIELKNKKMTLSNKVKKIFKKEELKYQRKCHIEKWGFWLLNAELKEGGILNKDNEEGFNEFKQLILDNPTISNPYYYLQLGYLHLNRNPIFRGEKKSIDYYKKAIELDENCYQAYCYLGFALIKDIENSVLARIKSKKDSILDQEEGYAYKQEAKLLLHKFLLFSKNILIENNAATFLLKRGGSLNQSNDLSEQIQMESLFIAQLISSAEHAIEVINDSQKPLDLKIISLNSKRTYHKISGKKINEITEEFPQQKFTVNAHDLKSHRDLTYQYQILNTINVIGTKKPIDFDLIYKNKQLSEKNWRKLLICLLPINRYGILSEKCFYQIKSSPLNEQDERLISTGEAIIFNLTEDGWFIHLFNEREGCYKYSIENKRYVETLRLIQQENGGGDVIIRNCREIEEIKKIIKAIELNIKNGQNTAEENIIEPTLSVIDGLAQKTKKTLKNGVESTIKGLRQLDKKLSKEGSLLNVVIAEKNILINRLGDKIYGYKNAEDLKVDIRIKNMSIGDAYDFLYESNNLVSQDDIRNDLVLILCDDIVSIYTLYDSIKNLGIFNIETAMNDVQLFHKMNRKDNLNAFDFRQKVVEEKTQLDVNPNRIRIANLSIAEQLVLFDFIGEKTNISVISVKFCFFSLSQENVENLLRIPIKQNSNEKLTLLFRNILPKNIKKVIYLTDKEYNGYILQAKSMNKDQLERFLKKSDRAQQHLSVVLSKLEDDLLSLNIPPSYLDYFIRMGLLSICSISEKKPIPWRTAGLVTTIAALQVTSGLAAIALTSGLAAKFGMNMVNNAVQNIFRTFNILFTRNSNIGSHLLQMALEYSVSLVTLGFANKTVASSSHLMSKKGVAGTTAYNFTHSGGASAAKTKVANFTASSLGNQFLAQATEVTASRVSDIGIDVYKKFIADEIHTKIYCIFKRHEEDWQPKLHYLFCTDAYLNDADFNHTEGLIIQFTAMLLDIEIGGMNGFFLDNRVFRNFELALGKLIENYETLSIDKVLTSKIGLNTEEDENRILAFCEILRDRKILCGNCFFVIEKLNKKSLVDVKIENEVLEACKSYSHVVNDLDTQLKINNFCHVIADVFVNHILEQNLQFIYPLKDMLISGAVGVAGSVVGNTSQTASKNLAGFVDIATRSIARSTIPLSVDFCSIYLDSKLCGESRKKFNREIYALQIIMWELEQKNRLNFFVRKHQHAQYIKFYIMLVLMVDGDKEDIDIASEKAEEIFKKILDKSKKVSYDDICSGVKAGVSDDKLIDKINELLVEYKEKFKEKKMDNVVAVLNSELSKESFNNILSCIQTKDYSAADRMFSQGEMSPEHYIAFQALSNFSGYFQEQLRNERELMAVVKSALQKSSEICGKVFQYQEEYEQNFISMVKDISKEYESSRQKIRIEASSEVSTLKKGHKVKAKCIRDMMKYTIDASTASESAWVALLGISRKASKETNEKLIQAAQKSEENAYKALSDAQKNNASVAKLAFQGVTNFIEKMIDRPSQPQLESNTNSSGNAPASVPVAPVSSANSPYSFHHQNSSAPGGQGNAPGGQSNIQNDLSGLNWPEGVLCEFRDNEYFIEFSMRKLKNIPGALDAYEGKIEDFKDDMLRYDETERPVSDKKRVKTVYFKNITYVTEFCEELNKCSVQDNVQPNVIPMIG